MTVLSLALAVLIWIVTPVSFVWSLITLRSHPTLYYGLCKAAVGVVACSFLLNEDASGSSQRFVAAIFTSLGFLTALLGMVDLLAVKVHSALRVTAKQSEE